MKKYILISIILLAIFSVSAVSAAENIDNNQTQNCENNLLSQSDNIQIENNNVLGQTNDKDTQTGNLKDLQTVVNNASEKETIYLNKDYKGSEGATVTISKSLTIDGQGHTIDCNKKCRAFELKNSKFITIKNLKIINGYDKSNGGSISITGCNEAKLINCVFENSESEDCGGAVYNDGAISNEKYCGLLNIQNCTFKNNIAKNNGGAVYIIGSVSGAVSIQNSNFIENTAKTDDGGAIYHIHLGDAGGAGYGMSNEFYIYDCNFIKNKAVKGDGGAIFTTSKLTTLYVSGSNFTENSATGGAAKRYGGAIRSNGNLNLIKDNFKNNTAENHGGAVYTECLKSLEDSNFEGNTAEKDYGGAIYINKATPYLIFNSVINCTFIKNKAVKGDGGAFYSDANLGRYEFVNCTFIGNSADGGTEKREGGAIRVNGALMLDNCYFKDNWAENHGGAIYADEIREINNTCFENNYVKNGCGGAIYINSYPSYSKSWRWDPILAIENSTFNNNYALKGDGGAIHSDSSSTIMNLTKCNFNGNYANDGVAKRYGGAINSKGTMKLDTCSFKDNWAENYGGAIYSDKIESMKNCSFTSNHAKEGGAIYVNSGCTLTIEKCYFNDNKATSGRGGAIYMDSKSAKLTLTNNAFVKNTASGQGKEVFNSGYYSTIKNNWWGENSPSFDNEKLMEYHTFGSNEKHKDENPNTVTVSFTERGNNTIIKVNFEYEIPQALVNDITTTVNGSIITNKTIMDNTIEFTVNNKINETDLICVNINSFATTNTLYHTLLGFLDNVLQVLPFHKTTC